MYLLSKYDPPPSPSEQATSSVESSADIESIRKNECRKRKFFSTRDPLLDEMTTGECLYVHTLYKKYSASTQDKLVNALKWNQVKFGNAFLGALFWVIVLYLLIGTIIAPKGIDRWILFFLMAFAGALRLAKSYFQI